VRIGTIPSLHLVYICLSSRSRGLSVEREAKSPSPKKTVGGTTSYRRDWEESGCKSAGGDSPRASISYSTHLSEKKARKINQTESWLSGTKANDGERKEASCVPKPRWGSLLVWLADIPGLISPRGVPSRGGGRANQQESGKDLRNQSVRGGREETAGRDWSQKPSCGRKPYNRTQTMQPKFLLIVSQLGASGSAD